MDEDIDCPHIAEAAVNVNVDVEKMRATLNNRSCNVCLRIDQLWMCMECKQILCGHIALGHTTAHFTFLKKHCLYINIESAAIYCYMCDSEVEPKNHDDELNRLRQFILYNQGPSTINNRNRRRQTAPKAIPPKKTNLKRGPRANKKVIVNSGTKNIINAVTQALGENLPEVKMVQELKNNNIQEEGKTIQKTRAKAVPKPRKRKARRGVTKRKTLKAKKNTTAVIKPKNVVKAKPKPKKVVIKRGPRTTKKVGITNNGNNCFMNAVWQALRHLKPFIYCLKLFKIHDIQKNNNNADPRNEKVGIAEELLKLMKCLTDWQKPANYKYRDAISPAALHAIVCKIKPRYKGYHQHDAHEFLMFTLDTLHSELRDEKYRLLLEEGKTHENPNKIDTLVSILFRGYLLSEVMCLNCKTVFKKNDPFTDISLDVPDYKNEPTEPQPEDLITDCLARYIQVEELNENNVYFCSTCQNQQKITKRFYINNLPNILCLQLKRFRWDNVYRTKVHTHIKFPTQSLDMSKYLDEEMKKKLTKEGAYMFDLSSIIVHAGEGGGSGHYTTYAIDEKDDQWYEYNDEKVHEVGEPMVQSVQAYVLIYIKREVKLNLCL